MRFSAALLLALALPCAAQHEKEGEKTRNPAIGDPQAIEAGRKLFTNGCAACHGADGRGGRGPDLIGRVFWHPLDDDTLFKAIQKGIPAGGMPPSNLPDEQAWQVVAYVRSMTAPAVESKVSGDLHAGEQLFWGKAGCGGCHRILGRGGALGPDLSNVGGARPLAQIREAIVDPDADGAIGYRAVELMLADGKTLQGVARNRTNYSIQLLDKEGKLHLVSMANVREMTISKGSPMPKDYGKRLSKQELTDILAYLSRQSVRSPEDTNKETSR